MSDATEMTVSDLLTAATEALATARQGTGTDYRHYADIALIYTNLAGTLDQYPDVERRLGRVVDALRTASEQGPIEGCDVPDLVHSAQIEAQVLVIGARHRRNCDRLALAAAELAPPRRSRVRGRAVSRTGE